MFVLDTNVVSEAMKPSANPNVRAWLNRQPSGVLYLSAVTLAELLYGIAALPDGRRKVTLAAVLDGLLDLFAGRILPFDTAAAQCYAPLAATARTAGRGFPTPDGYIAAIAAAQGYTVVTRDSSPFLAAGVPTLNPWDAA